MAKRPELCVQGSSNVGPRKLGNLLSKAPILAGFLLDTTYEGSDEVRQQSYIIIRPQGGTWFVTLKDPSTGLQLRVTVDSLDLVIGALEGLLTAPGCPWEIDHYASTNGARKRKK